MHVRSVIDFEVNTAEPWFRTRTNSVGGCDNFGASNILGTATGDPPLDDMSLSMGYVIVPRVFPRRLTPQHPGA